jgi:hypothetical protein
MIFVEKLVPKSPDFEDLKFKILVSSKSTSLENGFQQFKFG